MPTMGAMFLVAASGLLFSLSPGPSMMYVLSRSMGQGRQAGLASAFGLALGGVALAVFTASVSGWILAESEQAFRLVKLAGGAYLIYLGVNMLRDARSARLGALDPVSSQGFGSIVRQGFLVELLNPKTILFFLAFLPGFVDPDRGSIALQMLILGALIPLTAIPADVTVSVAGGWLAQGLRQRVEIGWLLAGLGGIVVVALGVRTLLTL